MTVPFYCLVIAFLFIYLSKLPVMKAAFDQGGYDNHHPRDQWAQLRGWGRRALAAHQNTIEAFPTFAAGVILAHLTGASPTCSAFLAVAFLVFRFFYVVLYLLDAATLRSIVWACGVLCSLSLCLLGVFSTQ